VQYAAVLRLTVRKERRFPVYVHDVRLFRETWLGDVERVRLRLGRELLPPYGLTVFLL